MSLRTKMILCPVLVTLFAVGLPLLVFHVPWPISIPAWHRRISTWQDGLQMESIFVGRVVAVRGWVKRTVIIEVLETLKGPPLPARMEFSPGTVAGTEDVGKRLVAYVPNLAHAQRDWRDHYNLADAGGLARLRHDYLVAPDLRYYPFEWGDTTPLPEHMPSGIILAENDRPLDLRDLDSRRAAEVPRSLIEHQKKVLLVQSSTGNMTPECVKVLEGWLKEEARYETPMLHVVRDFLKNLKDKNPEAQRMLEEYEKLPW